MNCYIDKVTTIQPLNNSWINMCGQTIFNFRMQIFSPKCILPSSGRRSLSVDSSRWIALWHIVVILPRNDTLLLRLLLLCQRNILWPGTTCDCWMWISKKQGKCEIFLEKIKLSKLNLWNPVKFYKISELAQGKVPYRLDIYELLNRTSSWIERVAAASGLVQEFQIVLAPKVKIKNNTSSVYSRLYGTWYVCTERIFGGLLFT